MSFFRRKLTPLVELHQFVGEPGVPGVLWDGDKAYVITIHQQRVYLEIGDWVRAEPNGVNYYPIKDEIKRETFDEYTSG